MASLDASITSPPPPALIDLLHSVPCVVALSSKVDNPKDFPEHLVDGKASTAWNSKTGDLHGYIAFRTPAVTRVKRVELTAGFDKVSPAGDLFTKNHRITRVRLSRGDKVVAEAALDPEVRTLQAIDVDEEGGDFRLDVLATLPGTEKKWQELAVSEFRVLGFANGAPENPAHVPAMAIGELDGVKVHVATRGEGPAGPFLTVEELCVAWDKAVTPLIDAAFPGDRYPGKIGHPHCHPLADPPPAAVALAVRKGPFKGGRFVALNDAEEEKLRLVLETDKGVSVTNVLLASFYHGDPGCGHASRSAFVDAKLLTASLGREVLVVRIARTDVYWQGSTNPGGTFETAYACSVDQRGAATCEGPLVVGRAPGWPDGWDVSAGTFPVVDLAKVKWALHQDSVLGPAGDLRLP